MYPQRIKSLAFLTLADKSRQAVQKKMKPGKDHSQMAAILREGGDCWGVHLGTFPTPHESPRLPQFHSAQVSLTMRNQDGGHCNPSGFLVSSFFVWFDQSGKIFLPKVRQDFNTLKIRSVA